jgi:hypothetical protein
MTSMTCPSCGHTDDCEIDARHAVLTCTECKARIAFGALMPRVVIEPHVDRRFVTLRFQTAANGQVALTQHVLDREFAYAVAREIASITAPPKTSADASAAAARPELASD